jgi:gas vesicle protein
MPKGPASTADDLTDTIRALVDRLVDAKFTQEMAKRGQEVASQLAERGADVGAIANDAWRDSKPIRRDAAKRLARATRDTAAWSDSTWRKALRPMLKDLWSRRTVALGAAGAAVPAGREIVDNAAVRLGLKEKAREERHWGAFFLGLLLGAAAGAIAAMLTTPKRGSEMRRELGARADEIAARAKDEWVPIFQRDETNGHATIVEDEFEPATSPISEGAADAAGTAAETAEGATADAAESVEQVQDAVDHESPA